MQIMQRSRSNRTKSQDGLATSCSFADSTDQLIACAEETFDAHADEIITNLQRNGIDTLDLAWPGTGFNQAAYGGQWQVMTALERRGGVRVRNVIGASGGASSAVLALADNDRSARMMMDTVMSSWWAFVTTTLEYNAYWAAMQSGNWNAVRNYGYAALKCDSPALPVIFVLHNFVNQDQAAKAFAASGDIPSSFLGNGYNLGGNLRGCHDGGQLMGMDSTPLLFFNTNYGKNDECNRACAIDLFKRGVQATINVLRSPDLQVTVNGAVGGSAAIQKPRGHWTVTQFRDLVSNGGFWEICIGCSDEERRFVEGAAA